MPAHHPAPRSLVARAEADIMAGWETRGPALVSVLCATYNHRDFIESALGGFLGQVTNYPFEIIIRDDASTDGTAEIVREYAKQYPHIIRAVFEAENQYSKGVKHQSVTYPLAEGKFIALCDGDDYWLDPLKMQKQHDFLHGHPEYVLCYQPALVVGMDGLAHDEYLFGSSKGRDDSAVDLQKGVQICNSAVFFRNHLATLPAAFYKLAFGDVFLFSFLGRHGKGRRMDGIAPMVYRMHTGGVWSGEGSSDQRINAAMSYLTLSQYFSAQINHPIAGHHLAKAMSCLAGLNPRLPWRMRFALAFPTLTYYYLQWTRRS